jgi:hypothetical protein
MKALFLTAVVLCGPIGSVVAQKKSTLMGDIVIGELTGMNAATREITVKYRGKEGPEIFTGTLADSYKLKTGDNIPQDLKLSEVVPGMHLRLFYKTSHEKVSGQEKKINRIVRIDILGKDEYFRIRNQLKLDPSTQIARAEKDDLPAISPLKVFLAVSYDHTHQQLAAWINKWNQKNGDSFGKLESVSDLDQADIFIVVAKGADTMVAALPMMGEDGVQGVWTQATSYVVVKDAGRLKVLWTGVAPVFSGPKAEVSLKTTELVVAEMEKRMKARAGNSKK